MKTTEKLPLDLTWQSDGHATEVALMILADGEGALLADGVERHIEACEACSMRLGDAALLSLRATEGLSTVAATLAATSAAIVASPIVVPVVRPVTRPLPVRAIAAALVVAILGVIPSLIEGLPRLPDFMTTAIRMLPVLGRTAISLLRGGADEVLGITPAASWLAACLFVVTGIALARTMSRARPLEGEVG